MAKQHTMNVSLTPQLAKMVADLVAEGRYASASEVVRDALRIVKEREMNRKQALRDIRKSLIAAEKDIDEGQGVSADRAFADVRRAIRRRRRVA